TLVFNIGEVNQSFMVNDHANTKNYIFIRTDSGEQKSYMAAYDDDIFGAGSVVNLNNSSDFGYSAQLTANDGTHGALIDVNAATQTNTYTADTHTFNTGITIT